jgi:putative hydroxymethylpyrimidine transport system permease protein
MATVIIFFPVASAFHDGRRTDLALVSPASAAPAGPNASPDGSPPLPALVPAAWLPRSRRSARSWEWAPLGLGLIMMHANAREPT